MSAIAPDRTRHSQVYARYLARRRAWKAARGDADAYRHIMQAHVATGFLYYYEPSARPSAGQAVWPYAWRWVACIVVVLTGVQINYWI